MRNERLRDRRIRDVFDNMGTDELPDRDEVDRRITDLMHAKGAGSAAILAVLTDEDRWAAFRAWYAMASGWAA